MDAMAGKQKGRHPQNALSAAFVKNAKGPGFYADGNGLYLKVDASGASRWVQRVMIGSRRRDIAIGPTSIVSLSEARGKALDNKRAIRSGIDPTREKKRSEIKLTFREATQVVFEIHRPSWRNEKHAAQFLSTLETYAFPHIGSLGVDEITTADVLKVLQPIWLTKAETARRVRQRIDLVMRWTKVQGWRQDNPTDDVAEALPKQDKSRRRHRKSLEYQRVAECLEAIRSSQAQRNSKLALEFLVLTASRSGEVRLMQKNEVDLGARLWRVPPERMKMKKEHVVPLPNRAIDIIRDALSVDDGSALVFPSARPGKPLSDATLLKLVNENGFDCHIHGFRGSFRTWAQDQPKVRQDVAEMCLAHIRDDPTEKAYKRSSILELRRELLQEWADFLGGAK